MVKKSNKNKKTQNPTSIQVATNKKALFNYEILDKFEAGVELLGWEVKSARMGTVNIGESFIQLIKAEQSGRAQALLKNSHFKKYKNTRGEEQDETRVRRLLLNRSEINKIHKAVTTKGVTVIALSIYFTSRGLLKAHIAVARGKAKHDKKQTIKERDLDRAAKREEY